MNFRESVVRHPTLSRLQLAVSLVANLGKIRSSIEPFGDSVTKEGREPNRAQPCRTNELSRVLRGYSVD